MPKQTLKKYLLILQKYLKIDMLYWFRGGFWLSVGQAITTGSSFLLSLAFANFFPPETYGTYRYILSTAGILAIPTLHGMHTALIQSVARGFEGSLSPALKARIKYGLLGGIASLFLGIYYFIQDNSLLSFSFLIAAVFLPFMDSFNLYEAILIGKKDFKTATKYTVISQVIALLGLVGTLFFTRNLLFTVFAYFFFWTLVRYISLHLTLRHIPKGKTEDPATLSYGKHLSFMGIIGTVASYLDRLLIFQLLGAVEVAVYSIAIAPPEQIKSLLKSINTLLLPKFSKSTLTEEKQHLKKNVLLFGIIVLGIIFIYVLAAPYLFRLVFPQYINAIFYSQLFALSLFSTILFIPITLLQSQKKNRALYSFNLYTSIFQIVLLCIGVYFYGLIGAIIARIISRTFNTFYSFYLIRNSETLTTD